MSPECPLRLDVTGLTLGPSISHGLANEMTLMDISKFNPTRSCVSRVYVYLTQNHARVIAGLCTQQLDVTLCSGVSSLSKHEVKPILVGDMCRKVCCILDTCFLHMPTTFLHMSMIKLNLCQICTILLIFFLLSLQHYSVSYHYS